MLPFSIGQCWFKSILSCLLFTVLWVSSDHHSTIIELFVVDVINRSCSKTIFHQEVSYNECFKIKSVVTAWTFEIVKFLNVIQTSPAWFITFIIVEPKIISSDKHWTSPQNAMKNQVHKQLIVNQLSKQQRSPLCFFALIYII